MSWHDSEHWMAENRARLRLITDGAWIASGSCRGLDPNLFHPERGESELPAKAVCKCCPVRQWCLDYALESAEKIGVWGGTSERQRRVLRRDSRRLAPAGIQLVLVHVAPLPFVRGMVRNAPVRVRFVNPELPWFAKAA